MVDAIRRYVANLKVLSASPSIKADSGEAVWKMNVQYPWCSQPELAYLPITEGSASPAIGTNGAVIERRDRKKGSSGVNDSDFDWIIVSLETITETSAAANGKVQELEEVIETPAIVQATVESNNEALSELDAETRAHAALKASAEMVAGYLSSSNSFKKDYTWKDMVEITTTVADAFLDWIDDATQREMERR